MVSFCFLFCIRLLTVKLKNDDYTTCTSKGDTVAIVATARKISKIIYNPLSICYTSWGLEVVIGSTIGLDQNQLAGTDAQRAADFQKQMDNLNIKAIWCSW